MDWDLIIDIAYDKGNSHMSRKLPGMDLGEWVRLIHCDYDWIDRLYIDSETIGGA